MTTRSYVSPVRTAAAAEKRERVIQAAADLLREAEDIAGFSLDAVAKAAGVTRLTVYHQFGSRRGLLEAVFDDVAQRGRLTRLSEAMADTNPRRGLGRLIEIFCDFWNGDPAVARLQDATALDPEFAQALAERHERRRKALDVLVSRIAPAALPVAQREAVDLIFALTSFAMFRMLIPARSPEAACAMIKDAAGAAIDRIAPI
ncbi:TetR/AcrR family transcriptional regulator [Sphingomonas alpina]|uniref:TetR/AcrR family transcriptional regulator n=1 Tax=Sphingomonas alpina TaxID=653931 RepID=A0A7H0LKS6_9SPHN|nr:TetR/AcrR family transcriptional regulator [Sphingomonas alpina]QNQ10279.1 TetR/AcrR family transcriptional regulator [Sphingomonas alpina]